MSQKTATQLKQQLGSVDLPEWQRDMADSARLKAEYQTYLAQVYLTDPVAAQVVFENAIGAIVWSRIQAGQYRGTLNGAFTPGKTFVRVDSFFFDANESILFHITGEPHVEGNLVQIQARNTATTDLADPNGFVMVEIRVYP